MKVCRASSCTTDFFLFATTPAERNSQILGTSLVKKHKKSVASSPSTHGQRPLINGLTLTCQHIKYQAHTTLLVFHHLSFTKKVVPIYAILARSIPHIHAEWLYNYAFKRVTKTTIHFARCRLSWPSILNFRSFAPKLPPKNSWISTRAQLHTSRSTPKVPRMFRTGQAETSVRPRTSIPPLLHVYANLRPLCTLSLWWNSDKIKMQTLLLKDVKEKKRHKQIPCIGNDFILL